MTGGISEGRGTLGKLVNDPAAYDRLNASLANLQEMTRRINAGEGSLGRLLKDDALAKSLTRRRPTSRASPGGSNRNDNTMGKLLTEKELYDRFNSVMARMDKLAADIQNAEGLARPAAARQAVV